MKPRCSSGVGGDGFAARRRQSRPRIFLVRRRFAPLAPALCAAAVVAFAAVSRAAVITWDGGNSDWVDGPLGNFNWIPTDEPDADDTAVFNSANTVNLADHNAVAALGLAGGISLNTNNYGLDIGGGLGLSGAGTTLIIGGTKSIVDADDVTIDPSARLRLNRGTLLLDEDAGTAVLDINAGGELFGTGVVSFLDVYAVATPVLTNDGILRAGPLLAVGLPSAGSMALTGTGNCRFDLDGTGALEPGVVTVMGNQTLDINAPLADPFRGDLNLYHGSVLDMSASWTLDGGTLDADNGAVGGSIPVAAGVSYVAGAPFYQDGGTITVTDEDGTLQFDAMFNQLSGNFANNGKVVFNANASIGASAHFTMPTASSSITVGPGATVTVNQADFDADGGDSPANVLTVAPLGTLNLHLGAGADTTLNGSLHLQRGTLRVTTATGAWRISGPVTIDGFSQDSVIRGDALSCSGQVTTVETGSGLTVNAPVTLEATSLCIVDGLLNLTAGTVFAGGRLEGNGALGLDGGSRVVADTSVDLPSFDWDGGVLGETHTIESGVTFTINSSLFDDIMDDAVTLVGDGSKLAFGGTSYWEMGATLTTNSAASGTVTIAGGARLLLASITGVNWQVNGNTIATAEVTFGRNSTTSVAAAARLTVDSNECWFDDAVITGAGTFYPSPALNSVFVPSTISVANLNFDRGDWRVAPGAFLDLQVGDYDADAPLNGFDKTLALDSGAIRVLTGDEVFVMNGTLHLHRSGDMPYWTGQAIQFGDDSGFHDAKLAVTGSGPSGIYAPILFKSDAEVDIAAGCQLLLARPVTFQSVNAGNNARFTGAGQLSTFDDVAVQETTTFEMAGGTVDLDGADGIGDLILVTAPFTIRAATLAPFGGTNPGGGTNQIDVNSWTGAGTLTVELDNPADEWTLNGPGVLRLINDPSSTIPRTLLAGSTLNTKGTLNIIGDVRSTARLNLAGLIHIQTVGKPLRLGGGSVGDPNTLSGGIIDGAGLLAADAGKALMGHGTIAVPISFAGARLSANNGILGISGAIDSALTVGTADEDGIFEVTHAWDSGVVEDGVYLNGGELRGGQITNRASGGISGYGLVSAPVQNETLLEASGSGRTLVVQTAANNNDWDGATENGTLATFGATLELRDDAEFLFNGSVVANSGTVFANGFPLRMGPGSNLRLLSGVFRHSAGTNASLAGAVRAESGTSRLAVDGKFGELVFQNSSATTLTGVLEFDASLSTIEAAATFNGGGKWVNLAGGRLAPADGANLATSGENRGVLAPGGTAPGLVSLKNLTQGAAGELEIGLHGTGAGSFDRLQISGNATLAGTLKLTLGGGYVPALGDTMTILTCGGRSGGFGPVVQPAGMPPGRFFRVSYTPTQVALTVVSSFEHWIDSFGITNPIQRTKAANPDGDLLNNLGEFALDGDPTSGAADGKVVGKIAPVGGVEAFTLTLPVRNGAVPDPADPVGGELRLIQVTDGLVYRVQASDDLQTGPLDVTEVEGDDALAIQAGLPTLNPGWSYRTFRSPGPVAGDPREFMRVEVSD